MNKSESIKELATALAKFQAEVNDPEKSGKGAFGSHVELNCLLDAVRPVLSTNGLSFIQSPGGDGTNITITTILLHQSGEWIEFDPLTLHAVKTDPQGAGSAITYARRYALSSILGVAWDNDDDGNKASGSDKGDKKNNVSELKPKETTDNDICKKFYINAKNMGWTDHDKIHIVASEFFGKTVTSMKDVLLTQQDANKFMTELRKRKVSA